GGRVGARFAGGLVAHLDLVADEGIVAAFAEEFVEIGIADERVVAVSAAERIPIRGGVGMTGLGGEEVKLVRAGGVGGGRVDAQVVGSGVEAAQVDDRLIVREDAAVGINQVEQISRLLGDGGGDGGLTAGSAEGLEI